MDAINQPAKHRVPASLRCRQRTTCRRKVTSLPSPSSYALGCLMWWAWTWNDAKKVKKEKKKVWVTCEAQCIFFLHSPQEEQMTTLNFEARGCRRSLLWLIACCINIKTAALHLMSTGEEQYTTILDNGGKKAVMYFKYNKSPQPHTPKLTLVNHPTTSPTLPPPATTPTLQTLPGLVEKNDTVFKAGDKRAVSQRRLGFRKASPSDWTHFDLCFRLGRWTYYARKATATIMSLHNGPFSGIPTRGERGNHVSSLGSNEVGWAWLGGGKMRWFMADDWLQ